MMIGPATAGFEQGTAAFARQDYATAYQEWRVPAEAGDPLAQYNLGVLYEAGQGVAQDPVEAAKWYRLAADQGLGSAQYNLGLAALLGRGHGQDDKAAAKWFEAAGAQGVALAQYNLGVLYASGRGVAQDSGESVKWTSLAAKQGVASAQYNLGVMYAGGWGVTQDKAAALHWYRLAADQGQAAAKAAADQLEAEGINRKIPASSAQAAPEVARVTAPPRKPAQPEIKTALSAPPPEPKIVAAPPPPQPAAPAPAPAPAASAPAAPAPAPAGTNDEAFAVQLVSLSSAEAAKTEGARLARAFSGLLTGLDLEVQEAKVADRNRVYRVRFAPLGSKAAARELCQQLKAQAQDCLVLVN
jgi:TPR repeat protein